MPCPGLKRLPGLVIAAGETGPGRVIFRRPAADEQRKVPESDIFFDTMSRSRCSTTPLSFNCNLHLPPQSQEQSQLGLDCKIQFFVSFSSMHKHPTILPDIVTKPAAANENQSPRRHAPRPQASPPRESSKERSKKRYVQYPAKNRQSMLPKTHAHHDRDRRIVSHHHPAFAHPPPLGPVPAPACQCSMLLDSVSSRDQKQRAGSRCA